jgi:hypothetical protein
LSVQVARVFHPTHHVHVGLPQNGLKLPVWTQDPATTMGGKPLPLSATHPLLPQVHELLLQVPPTPVIVLVHVTPHAPQFAGSAEVSASHPFEGLPSQSANGLTHCSAHL